MKKCACGRGLPLLKSIEGRQVDGIITSEGRCLSGEFFLYIIDRFSWVKRYKVVQKTMDSFVIRIAKRESRSINSDIGQMEREIKKVLGHHIKVKFELLDALPLETSGKNRLVVSKAMLDRAPKKKKVLHMVMSLEYGGAEKVVVNLINNMVHSGFEFSIFALDGVGPLKEQLPESVDISSFDRKNGIDFSLPLRLSRAIRSYKPDVIHFHNTTCLFYGAIAAKIASCRNMVYTQHGISPERKRMLMALRVVSRMLNKAVAVSGNIAEYFDNIYGVDKIRIELIINGIDEEKFRKNDGDGLKAQYGINGGPVLGHVARLSPEKDQMTLLKSFSTVVSNMPKAKLVIVGGGQLENALKSFTEKLGLTDNVIFAGSRQDVGEFLDMFDIFVLSSLREGTSLTLLEAMAKGLPVVATDVGGTPDVVDHERTGLLVPASDPDSLADALLELLQDKDRRREMGDESRRKIEKAYTLNVMGDKYADIYNSL